MFTLREKNPALFAAINYAPYSFGGDRRNNGYAYCLHAGQECVAHGIVFGERERIVDDLRLPGSMAIMTPGAAKLVFEWIEAGDVPYLPAARALGQVGSCLLRQEPRVYSRQWIRPPGPNATDAARRIYEARMRARDQRESKGLSHV